MLTIIVENEKLNNLEDYDRVVKVEIPNEEEEHKLYNAGGQAYNTWTVWKIEPRLSIYEEW